MLIPLAFADAFTGFSALCLSMPRHQRDVLGRNLSQHWGQGLRAAGYLLLALTYWPCLEQTSASVGILLWIGILSTTAMLLVSVLAWKARAVLWSAPVALTAALFLQGFKL